MAAGMSTCWRCSIRWSFGPAVLLAQLGHPSDVSSVATDSANSISMLIAAVERVLRPSSQPDLIQSEWHDRKPSNNNDGDGKPNCVPTQVLNTFCKSLEEVQSFHQCSLSASSGASSNDIKEKTVQNMEEGLTASVATSFVCEEIENTHPANLSWQELTCCIKDQHTMQPKQLLWPCTGSANVGQMHALLGPSGAGKTTMLDMLAMRKSVGILSGQVMVNGRQITADLRQLSSVVDQEDLHLPMFSAIETLMFHGRLRLGKASAELLQSRVQAILACMGLWRCRHTQVGGMLAGGIKVHGLSGGERRRLTIACSLIANPAILFMDEPTTGLDSFAALSVMQHVCRLARLGHTIIATIHQPGEKIWKLLDKVTILSEGYQLYTGDPYLAEDWFRGLHYDYYPARDGAVSDWLMDLVAVGFDKRKSYQGRAMGSLYDIKEAARFLGDKHSLARQLQQKQESTELLDSLEDACHLATHRASFGTQVLVLLQRSMQSQLRNPTDAAMRILLSVWSGILSGLVYWNLPNSSPDGVYHTLSALFTVLLIFMLTPFSFMTSFSADRRQLQSDIATNLHSPLACHLAMTLAGLPITMLNALVGGYALYGMAGLRNDASSILLHGLINIVQSGASMQFLIACVYLCKSLDMAYALATAYTAASVLLSGLYVRKSEFHAVPMKWLSYLSMTKYAMNGLAQEQYKGWNFTTPGSIAFGLPATSNSGSSLVAASLAGVQSVQIEIGDDILEYWEYNASTAEIIGILGCMYVAFHLLSYFAMAYLHKQKR